LDIPTVVKTGQYLGKPHVIKSLLINGGGVVGGIVDMNVMLNDVFAAMDLVVCMDVAWSDTALHSDIVLPGTVDFEAEDIYISPLNRVVQFYPQLIEPMYEAKSSIDFFNTLAKGMGLGQAPAFNYTADQFLSTVLDNDTCKAMGITLDALKTKGDMAYAPPTIAGMGGYPTPSGKVEFYWENPAQRVVNGAQFDPSKYHLASFEKPLEAWPDSDTSSQYPFILMSERSRNRWHSSNFNVPWLNELDPEVIIRMNPDDAAAAGVKSGDYIECYNDRGSAVAKVAISAGIRPGVLSYPKGMQQIQYKAGNMATLTSNAYDPIAVNSSFFDCRVGVRAWKE
jgi:molybdopterin-containing oxidoreductase family molybdopterin binding subunit